VTFGRTDSTKNSLGFLFATKRLALRKIRGLPKCSPCVQIFAESKQQIQKKHFCHSGKKLLAKLTTKVKKKIAEIVFSKR